MILSWLGNSAFKLTEKEVTVLIAPYAGMPKTQADIVLLPTAKDRQSVLESVKGEPIVIDTPGEYEIKGVFMYGVPAKTAGEGKKQEDTVLYSVEIDGVTVAHFGNFGQPQLTEAQLEILEGAHILLMPLDAGLSVEQTVNVVNRIEPRIVIPMQYKKTTAFVDEIGLKPETVEKLKLTKKELPTDDMKLYILTQS